MNKISALYGKGKYSDTTKFGSSGGRSFKMEDLGYGALTRTASYKYARHSDGKIYRYEADATVDGTSTTGGTTTIFKYMELDASNSIEETPSSHTWKKLPTTENSYITMYQYTYSGSQTLPIEVSEADTDYWLASRYLIYGDRYVFYGTREVNTVKNYGLHDSEGHCYYGFHSGIRPVVYLKSDIKLSYDATNGYTISE